MGKNKEESTGGFSEASFIQCDVLNAGYSSVFYHNIALYVCMCMIWVCFCMYVIL